MCVEVKKEEDTDVNNNAERKNEKNASKMLREKLKVAPNDIVVVYEGLPRRAQTESGSCSVCMSCLFDAVQRATNI